MCSQIDWWILGSGVILKVYSYLRLEKLLISSLFGVLVYFDTIIYESPRCSPDSGILFRIENGVSKNVDESVV